MRNGIQPPTSRSPLPHTIPSLAASAKDDRLEARLLKFLATGPIKLSDLQPAKALPDQVPDSDQLQTASSENPTPAPAQVSEPAPAFSSAIARCTQAFVRAYNAAVERRKCTWEIEAAAGIAYRKVMPPLLGKKNIREFIACVAHGLLLGAINHNDATKLLYAAQIASSTPNQPKKIKKEPKSDEKPTCISAPQQPQPQTSQQVTPS